MEVEQSKHDGLIKKGLSENDALAFILQDQMQTEVFIIRKLN